MAVATAYPTSSEGHMEKLLKTMIQEELEDRLQKEFAAQRMAEKENSEAEAEEENLLLKAEEAEIELDLEEAEEQVIFCVAIYLYYSWLHKLMHILG